MEQREDNEILRMLKQKKRKRFWSRMVSVMMCLVVFCTTYALILPAITKETDTFCGIEAHTHTDDCYHQVLLCEEHVHDASCYEEHSELICGLAETEGHIHTEQCIPQTEAVLSCGLEETPGHTHMAECCVTEQTLSCGLEESSGHTHTESCISKALTCSLPEDEAHTHDDNCYTAQYICGLEESKGHAHADACYTVQTTYVCGLEETSGHQHDDTCWTEVTTYGCGLQEAAAHAHTEACYNTTQVQICTIETTSGHEHTESCYDTQQTCQLEEHTHSLPCYADPNADLETAAVWEQTLPEQLTGSYTEDVLAIARSQLGYAESTRNYIVEGQEVKGYTRYGAWYGSPYGDWCAMYVSFCLHYAGVENYPLDSNCPNWILTLTEQNKFQDAEDYIPASGDIIFFDWDEDGDADHVGIVAEYLPAEEDEPAMVRTIEGNSGNCVQYNLYAADDNTIMGCGVLPARITEEEDPQVNSVIDLIDTMPSADEIDAKIAEFEEAGDEDGEIAWLEQVYQQVAEVYKAYSELNEDQKAHVTNADKLLDLEYIWSVMVLPETTDAADYYCGYGAHEESCYDDTGALICTDATHHEHTADCEVLYYCGMIEQHKHSGCYDNFDYTCGKVEHTHNYLCATKPQYCEKQTHIHSWQDCYNADGELICDKHVHILSCWVNPESAGTNTDEEDYFDGTGTFHSSLFLKYQASSHTVSSYEIGAFALIPDEYYTENWVPNTRQWSADADANYLVAFCSDDRTTSSKKGEDYAVFAIDNSRFSDDTQQRKVAGIIGHTYPFLTAEEMREQLEQAYAAGLTVDNDGNLVDVRDCVEADWLGAAQWAIWNTTTTFGEHYPSDVDIDDYGRDRTPAFPLESERSAINPLTDPGITDIATSRQKLCAIKNYLCSITEPEALEVSDYSYELVENADGTYRLEVTVNLNRAIVFGENTQFQLLVGEKTSTLETLPVGDSQIQMSLDGLTLEEINTARVHLTVDGKHMQAYFFDSDNYQDMVGGNWEYYDEDLSFDLGKEKVDVAVSKVWKNGDPASDLEVKVQLYSDGRAYGKPVILNAANSWSYSWTDLNKYNAAGNEVNYTLEEELISGYYSHIEKVTEYTTESTVKVWQQADAFEDGGHYLLVSRYGALVANPYPSNKSIPYYLNVGAINVNEVTDAQHKLTWIAEDSDGDGYFSLENKKYTGQYLNYDCISSDAYDYFVFDSGRLRRGTSSYFFSFYSNGYQVYTSNRDRAMGFTLYKLVEIPLPATDINFLVTNSKYVLPDTGAASATVTKEWAGRPDNCYPESAQVQLLANGQPYGDPVTLNADNEWRYTWTNLPVLVDVANDGQVFLEYTVAELDADGYRPTYSSESTGTHFVNGILNTWTPETLEIELRKIDSEESQKLLSGAAFDLYLTTNSDSLKLSGTGEQVPGENVYGVKLDPVIFESGSIKLEVAAGETYYLVETKAPAGYNLLDRPIGFTVSEDGTTIELIAGSKWAEVTNDPSVMLTIRNEVGYELPETGGTGTQMYTAAGLLLMLSSAAYLMYSYKKRRKEVS